MKEKLAEMEAEAKKLREVQAQVEKDLSTQCQPQSTHKKNANFFLLGLNSRNVQLLLANKMLMPDRSMLDK